MNHINPEITQLGINSTLDFYQTIAVAQKNFSEVQAFVTDVDSSFLNLVVDLRTNNTDSANLIITLEEFFNQHKVPWSWMLTPLTKINHLDKFGFSLLETTSGMYFDLGTPLPNNANDSLSIKELQVPDELLDWIQPIYEGFGANDQGEKYRQLNANLLKNDQKKLRQFVAYYKNEVAAAATLFLSENSVMLHNLATKTKFQNLGIGTALTIHIMDQAKTMGYKHCFLDSSEQAFNLYKHLGFQVYCTNSFYIKT